MSRIRCFFLAKTDQCSVRLRRYAGVRDGEPLCPTSGLGYHNAEVEIGRITLVLPDDRSGRDLGDDNHDDPRWPTRCSCGYAFIPSDPWQHEADALYSRSDTGELVTLRVAPVGAIWECPWMSPGCWPGPDGKILCVKTPGGDWLIDGGASNGPRGERGWQRTGTVPNLTATPSIGIGDGKRGGVAAGAYLYHGWLRDGWLEEC